LVEIRTQGRHRYHRIASPDIARMLEAIVPIAAGSAAPQRQVVTGPRDAALRRARTCYDHLAGRLGVAMADGLLARGAIELGDAAVEVTGTGVRLLATLGIDVAAVSTRSRPRPLCRPCLDWSERRPHLAGPLGAAIGTRLIEAGHLRRMAGTRAVKITASGRKALFDLCGISDL